MNRMKWRHTLFLAAVMVAIGGAVYGGTQLVDTLLGNNTITVKANVASGTEILSVQGQAANEILGVTNGNSSTLVKVTGDTDGSAVGPLTLKATGFGSSIGAALSIDATADTGGAAYSFIATGPGAGVGAGHFSFFKSGTGYQFDLDPSGNVTPGNGNVNQAIGSAGQPWYALNLQGGPITDAFVAVGSASTSFLAAVFKSTATPATNTQGQNSPGLQFQGNIWNGSASANGSQTIYLDNNTYANLPTLSGSVSYNGSTSASPLWSLGPNSTNLTGGKLCLGTGCDGYIIADTTTNVMTIHQTGGYELQSAGSGFGPSTVYSGLTTGWSKVQGETFIGATQAIAAAATITLNPASGEDIRIALGATAITTINGAAGGAAQRMRVTIVQDATGGRLISGWAAGTNGFALQSTYVPSPAANAIDVITFTWDATSSLWREASRSQSVPQITTFPNANYQGTSTNLPTVTWTTLGLTNSWTVTASTSAAAYFKDGLGQVHVSFDVTNASSSGAVAFTLPVGFRPRNTVVQNYIGGSSGGGAQIATNGQMSSGTACTRMVGEFSYIATN